MRVFLLLDRRTGAVVAVGELSRQLLDHRLARALARSANDPAKGEGSTSLGADVHRNLVRLAAATLRPNFDVRHRVGQRLVEDLEGGNAQLLFGLLERTVEDPLGDRLLAVEHHSVDKSLHHSNKHQAAEEQEYVENEDFYK